MSKPHAKTAIYTSDSNNLNELTICHSIDQAAQSILRRSFAIYRLNDETYQSLCHAWKASYNFLTHTNIHYQQSRNNNVWATKGAGTLCASPTTKEGGHRNPDQTKRSDEYYYKKYRRITKGNLYGLNRPSDAKLLYRTFYLYNHNLDSTSHHSVDRANMDIEGGDGGSGKNEINLMNFTSANDQPWPDDYDHGTLKASTNEIAFELHKILLLCKNEIIKICRNSNVDGDKGVNIDRESIFTNNEQDHDQSLSGSVSSKEAKKRKLNASVSSSDSLSTITAIKMPILKNSSHQVKDEYRNEYINNDWNYLPCPLDYFFYHNMNQNVVNCSEHIDRGVLICISLTTVKGLEVLSSLTNEWVCPEDLTIVDDDSPCLNNDVSDKVGCSMYLCILSGDHLMKTISNNIATRHCKSDNSLVCMTIEDLQTMYSGLEPCRHRVKNTLARPRLSISYELRQE